MVIIVPWFFYLKQKHMATPVVMAIGKETSNPLTFNDSPLTGVYTPGSDDNRLKLKRYDVHFAICC